MPIVNHAMSTANQSPILPRATLLTIAAAQGLILLALHKAFEAEVWPSKEPLWFFPLTTLAIVIPAFLLLTLQRGNEARVIVMCGGVAVVLAALAVYTGWQAKPLASVPPPHLTLVYTLSTGIACFKLLMYLQQLAEQQAMSYQVLFTYSWRNFLVLGLAGLFVLAFSLVLTLWASLFSVIGIKFFTNLFKEDWFLYPVLGFASGLGVVIFRDLTRVIDSITRLLSGLCILLLPLVLLIAVVFVLALPFTGLEVLWSTGNGTSLLLWLLAVILFFANAVYQDGREENSYPTLIHRLIYIGLCVMPVLCALSFYGLSLRVAQYGWSVERCWAFVVWLFLTLFSLGYVWGIVTRRSHWPTLLARVNTIMGLVILTVLLLANSPLLDFRKLSLSSQLARLESNEVELDEFDFYYTKHTLARPGYLALARMKIELGDSNPRLLMKINNPEPTNRGRDSNNAEEFWQNLVYRPALFDVPDELAAQIERNIGYGGGRNGMRKGRDILIKIDLDSDAQAEYVLLQSQDKAQVYALLFYFGSNRWELRYMQRSDQNLENKAVEEMLLQGVITLQEPRFKDLLIGDLKLEVQ